MPTPREIYCNYTKENVIHLHKKGEGIVYLHKKRGRNIPTLKEKCTIPTQEKNILYRHKGKIY